jgi:hypothetical protein
LLLLRSVLDNQIRRVERQTKQQAAVETPLGDGTLDQRSGSQQRKHVQPRSKFEHLVRGVGSLSAVNQHCVCENYGRTRRALPIRLLAPSVGK